ncbi:regulatory LuxR family protein [Streptomyces sp. Ag109_O5-1]|uniref:helix-turn-helix transcriptional regulator n=1 Tax=Streptomyces sp. Ag109_O5-1 TaxID=1938851 RepID=UPI000F50078E|nr:LuxR family transcriptional regulator [Streptomyces sp. Ag109_O5-1]RPE39159.1 regulatory LuxR family protein [Streptomyces sp. Ag109_O5-1]
MRRQRGAVIGRDGDIRAVEDAFRATGDAARVLVVTAGAGMGKTAVLEQVRHAAAQDGAAVVRLGWEGEDTRDMADAIVVAGCGLVLADPDDCLLPLPTALRARLGAAAREGGASGLSAFSDALAAAARQMPFTLVVDGIERMPRHVADALSTLLRIFRPHGVPVVMAGRPQPAADPRRAQLTAAADQVLELAPLRPTDVAALVDIHVTRRFNRPAEPALAESVSRALGCLAGNPRAVLSLLGTLDKEDLLELDGRMCLTRAEKQLRLTTEEAFLLGFGRPHAPPYPGIVEAAIITACLLDHAEVHVDDVFRLAPSADARALEHTLGRLVTDRILTADPQGRLSFAVPALAAALRTLPIRRDVQGNYARFVTRLTDKLGAEATGRGYPRLADHVAALGPLLADSLAVPLLLAAAREEARTNWPRSARAYTAALDRLTPRDQRTPDVLHEASSLSLRHGDHDGILALGKPLLALLDTPHTEHTPAGLSSVATAWVWAALHEHRAPCANIIRPRSGEKADPFPAAAGLAALGGLYGIGPLTPRTTMAACHTPDTDPGHRRTPLPSPAELHLVAAAVASHTELSRARRNLPPDTIDDQALDQLRHAAAYADLAGALAAVLGDRYVAAEEGIALQYRGMVRDYLTGNWDAALTAARRIELRSRTRATTGTPHLPRALAAEIHCTRGDIAYARAWLEMVPDALTHPLAARARLALQYWSGRTEEALEGAWHDARQARKNGQLAGLERLLLRILSITVREDRPHMVQQALEELQTLQEEAATPMTHEALLIARGIAHRDTDSALTAHHLIEHRGDVHLSVISSLCLTDIADDPRPWLIEAMRNANGLGLGRPFRSAVTRAAQRRNIPVPRLRQTNEKLTELDIALVRMVSAGVTNRQIAAELSCSHKTVEQRLTRLFQRTGSHSRAELTAAWLNGTLTRTRIATDSDPPSPGPRTTAAPPHAPDACSKWA